jgi:hypothetical protein
MGAGSQGPLRPSIVDRLAVTDELLASCIEIGEAASTSGGEEKT